MRITTTLINEHCPYKYEAAAFASEYPDGIEASGENVILLAAEGFNVLWIANLLPDEGPGSKRAFALWCAEQVAHLSDDPRVAQCLDVIRREVLQPGTQDLNTVRGILLSIIHMCSSNAAKKTTHAAWIAACRDTVNIPVAAFWNAICAKIAAYNIKFEELWITEQEPQLFMLGEMLKEL